MDATGAVLPNATVILLPGWDMTLAYAYNEARIAEDATYPVGNVFQNAPRHGGSLWTVYELQHGILTGPKFGRGVSARKRQRS
jgi:iron complex outermembrane receptor protein